MVSWVRPWALTVVTILLMTGAAPARALTCDFLFGWLHRPAKETELVSRTVPPPEIGLWERQAAELARIRSLPNGDEKNAAIRAYSKPTKKTALAKSYVLMNWALSLGTTAMVAKGLMTDPARVHLLVEFQLLSLYTADFTSQVFHKWLDSIASTRGKWWGPVVGDFRKHHEFANNLNEEDYLSNVSDFALPMMPAFAATAVASPYLPPEVTAGILSWLLATFNTPEMHKQAHLGRNASPFFKALQAVGLSVPSKVHLAHHAPPFDDNFAVTLGWFNPMAKRLQLWERWDRHKWKTTRELPNTWVQDPRSIPPDVMEEILANPTLIKPELWANANVYPERVPLSLRPLLKDAQQAWKVEFIFRRRLLFQEAAVTDPGKSEAEYAKDWDAEQAELKWIYGDLRVPLFEEPPH